MWGGGMGSHTERTGVVVGNFENSNSTLEDRHVASSVADIIRSFYLSSLFKSALSFAEIPV